MVLGERRKEKGERRKEKGYRGKILKKPYAHALDSKLRVLEFKA
jgi:hypothetical protein